MRSLTLTAIALMATAASAGPVIEARQVRNGPTVTAGDDFLPRPSANAFPRNATADANAGKVDLKPVIDPKRPKSLEEALKPHTRHVIWLAYGNPLDKNGQVAIDAAVDIKTKKPTVNLGANHDVVGLVCKDQAAGKATSNSAFETMTVKFANNENRDKALALWQTAFKEGLYFIDAYGDGCGKADALQFIGQKPGSEVKKEDKSLVFSVKGVQDTNTIKAVQKEAIVGLRMAWGKDHKMVIQRTNAEQQAKSRFRRQENTPEADAFESDWPTGGEYPAYSDKSNLAKRGIDFGIGWASWDDSSNIDWPTNTMAGKLTKRKSPWYTEDGKTQLDGYKLNPDGLSEGIWCVDCGFKGRLVTSGVVGIGWGGFYSNAVINLSNARASAHLGITYDKMIGEKEWEGLKKKLEVIESIPVSPLALGNLLIVGPAIKIGPFVKVELKTTGRFLLGGTLEWSNAQAKYNSKSGKGIEQSGWKPKSTARMDLDAEISAKAAAGLHLEFTLGLTTSLMDDIIGISIIDEGAFFAESKANLGASITKDKKGKWHPKVDLKTGEGCNGLRNAYGVENRLYLQAGLGFKTFQWDTIDPEVMKAELGDFCWKWADILEMLNKGNAMCMRSSACVLGSHM